MEDAETAPVAALASPNLDFAASSRPGSLRQIAGWVFKGSSGVVEQSCVPDVKQRVHGHQNGQETPVDHQRQWLQSRQAAIELELMRLAERLIPHLNETQVK